MAHVSPKVNCPVPKVEAGTSAEFVGIYDSYVRRRLVLIRGRCFATLWLRRNFLREFVGHIGAERFVEGVFVLGSKPSQSRFREMVFTGRSRKVSTRAVALSTGEANLPSAVEIAHCFFRESH
jgi:hypothetical protein